MATCDQPPNSNTDHDSPFKVHIAIDFGTDGLGVAYAINNEIYVHSKWNSRRYADTVKPKTIILLNEQHKPVCFGLDARTTYMNLQTEQKHQWMLFERFKMSLYEDQLSAAATVDDDFHDNDAQHTTLKRPRKPFAEFDDDSKTDADVDEKTCTTPRAKIGIKEELTAMNGKTCRSELVFVAALQYIQQEAKKYLRKKKIKAIGDDEIAWILTVPAIWNDDSKNKMKQWAVKAGLVDAGKPSQCRIVYEPDCGSLAIQQQIGKGDVDAEQLMHGNGKPMAMSKGERYILIDAGGGTVDIACHEIMDGFGVKEILPPSGGKWGSCYIDDQYVKLLRLVFNKSESESDWIEEFQRTEPNVFVEIIDNFQEVKAKFYEDANKKQHNVRLPDTFLAFIDEKLDADPNISDPETLVAQSVLGKSGSVVLEDDYLNIDVVVWKSMLFDKVINPIIVHTKALLKQLEQKADYLCLVGGLSCSPYFQHRMKCEFGVQSKYKLRFVIPKRPILSVVEGAAYFGLLRRNEAYIKARRLRKTYGFVISESVEKAEQMGVSKEYIEENKFCDENNGGEFMVAGCFKVMARRNQEIDVNQVVTATSFRTDTENMYVKCQILCSELEDPKTVLDAKEVAEYTLRFENKQDVEIIDEFHFYDTMIKVYAYTKNAPHKKSEVELSYVYD